MKKILKSLARLVVLLATVLSAPESLAAPTVTYYHNDLAGSPVVATNAQGQVIWRESYRPYGERLTNAPLSASNDIWFTSRRQDTDTGLVYMGARYYDPVVGRFYSTDPAGFVEGNVHSFNRYAYANNNPYRYRDPDGKWSLSLRDDNNGSLAAAAASVHNESVQAIFQGAQDAVGRVFDAYLTVSSLALAVDSGGTSVALREAGSAANGARGLAADGKLLVDANKLNHIFSKARHNLGGVAEQFGSRENAFAAIRDATEEAVKARQITGVFETTIKLGGTEVTVEGKVVDGVVKIGTAYIP